jgi:hypothetical protein
MSNLFISHVPKPPGCLALVITNTFKTFFECCDRTNLMKKSRRHPFDTSGIYTYKLSLLRCNLFYTGIVIDVCCIHLLVNPCSNT